MIVRPDIISNVGVDPPTCFICTNTYYITFSKEND